jgi:hypothetical protein
LISSIRTDPTALTSRIKNLEVVYMHVCEIRQTVKKVRERREKVAKEGAGVDWQQAW